MTIKLDPCSTKRLLVLLVYALAVVGLLSEVAMAGTDAERGREVFLDRDLGHCVLCHRVAHLDIPFQGNIGPDLTGVADRMSIDAMREKVSDPTLSNPNSTMPGYYRTHGLEQVAREYRGRPVLTAAQLQDLLAYLATLKQAE